MPFPIISNPLDKQGQIKKIKEELKEWLDEKDPIKAAIEFQDLHHALITYERTHFTPEEVNKARVAVIEKNRLRGYYD